MVLKVLSLAHTVLNFFFFFLSLCISLDFFYFLNFFILLFHFLLDYSSGLSPLYSPVNFCGTPLGQNQKRIPDLSLNTMIGESFCCRCNLRVLWMIMILLVKCGLDFSSDSMLHMAEVVRVDRCSCYGQNEYTYRECFNTIFKRYHMRGSGAGSKVESSSVTTRISRRPHRASIRRYLHPEAGHRDESDRGERGPGSLERHVELDRERQREGEIKKEKRRDKR